MCPTLEFSVAHTSERVVLAITYGAQIGVDAEMLRNFSHRQLAALSVDVLSDDERAGYDRVPPASRARALTTWWTRKEAVLKATGHGLVLPMTHLTVTEPSAAPAVTAWHSDLWLAAETPPLRLHDLVGTPTLVAALAVVTESVLVVGEHDGDALLP
jgi:4'-phosphopantetheinyl transferase